MYEIVPGLLIFLLDSECLVEWRAFPQRKFTEIASFIPLAQSDQQQVCKIWRAWPNQGRGGSPCGLPMVAGALGFQEKREKGDDVDTGAYNACKRRKYVLES